MGRHIQAGVENLHKELYEYARKRYPELLIESWEELTEEQRIRIREAQQKHIYNSNLFER